MSRILTFSIFLVKAMSPSTPARRRRSLYSKGEINRLIDCLLHPLSDINPAFSLADAILHGLVEENPPETALKFLRYNLPRIIGKSKGDWKSTSDS